jgi:hypothetical protein
MIPPKAVGCPIRRSEDQRALAPPLGFSQRATSFIASRCQGIHQMPFSRARPRPAPSTPAGGLGRGQTAARTRQPNWLARSAPATGSPVARHESSLPPGRRAPALHCIPMPRRAPAGPEPRAGMARACFTVTTRFTMSEIRGRRSAIRSRDRPPSPPQLADSQVRGRVGGGARRARLNGGPGPI